MHRRRLPEYTCEYEQRHTDEDLQQVEGEGALRVTISPATPPTLYYYCPAHPGMGGVLRRVTVPAREARKGVPNPFKPGELMDVPAKPATTKVKVRALKNLKNRDRFTPCS